MWRETLVVSLFVSVLASLVAERPLSQPHIVLVIVDDAGTADTQFSHPNSPIKTSRLDAIAKEGIVLK